MREWCFSDSERAGAWLLRIMVGVVCLLAWFDNLLSEEAWEFRFSLLLLGIAGVLSIAVAQYCNDPLLKWCRVRAFWLLATVVAISLINPSHTQVYTSLNDAPEQIRGPQEKAASDGQDRPLVLIQTFRPNDKPRLLQALPETVNVRRSIASASSLLAAILLGGSTYRLVKGHRRRAKMVCLVIFLNGILLSWVGLYFQQQGGRDLLGHFQTPNPRFFGSFRYNNLWVGWIVITIGMGVGLAKDVTRRGRSNPASLWILGSVLLIPPLLLSHSRSAIILAIVIVTYRFWRYLRKLTISRSGGTKKAVRLRLRSQLVYFAMALLCLCIAVFYSVEPLIGKQARSASGGRLKDTAKQLETLRAGDNPFLRPALARDALKLAAQRPIFGWGLGSFEYAHPGVAGPEFSADRFQRETSSYGHLIRSRYVHNDWAQALAELGLVGAGALFMFILNVIRTASAGTRSTSLSHYVMFGCCCTLLLSLWDSPLNNPSIQSLFGVSVALSLATRRPVKPVAG